LTNSYSALSPTYVQMTVKFGNTLHIGPPSSLRFADDKIGSAFIPANTIIRLVYWNKTGGTKQLVAYGQYLY